MVYKLIREGNGHYRLIKRYMVAGDVYEREETMAEGTREMVLTALREKKEFARDLVEMSCWNPMCSNTIVVTPEQKRDFLISFQKKYGKTVFPCCCKECRDTVQAMFDDE